MTDAHAGIGMALVIGFAVLLVLSLLRLRGSGPWSWAKYLAMAVSALLLVQYAIGLGLLMDDYERPPLHYIFALAAILPVGAEHMMASSPAPADVKARKALWINLAAFACVLISYGIGDRG